MHFNLAVLKSLSDQVSLLFAPCRYWLCYKENCHLPVSDQSGGPRWRQVWLQNTEHPQELWAHLHDRGWVWWVHQGTRQQKYQGWLTYQYEVLEVTRVSDSLIWWVDISYFPCCFYENENVIYWKCVHFS